MAKFLQKFVGFHKSNWLFREDNMKNRSKIKNPLAIELEVHETQPKWMVKLFRAIILSSPVGIYILVDFCIRLFKEKGFKFSNSYK